MTISTTASEVTLSGNGATTAFNFSFIAGAASNIVVVFTDASGNQSTLLQGSQYILALNAADPGQIWGVGGTVTYPLSGAPILAGTTLSIQRIVPLTQTTSISNQGAFYPQAVERALDILCMEIQQVGGIASRALLYNPIDVGPFAPLPAVAQRASQLLGFDSLGNPIAAEPTGALVSSVMQPVVEAASTTEALALLGATAGFPNIGVLRSFSGLLPPGLVWIEGYYTAADGGEGMFIYQPADTTSADNGGTVIVDTLGHRYYRETQSLPLSIRWFGAKGDGATDDTAAIEATISASTGEIWVPGGSYLVSSQINIGAVGLRVTGAGSAKSIFICLANFASIFNFSGTAAGIEVTALDITQTGTTTRCVTFAQGAQVTKFFDCSFTGDMSGTLVYSQAGGYIEFWSCVWNCNAAGTVGLTLDGFNQNTVIQGGHAGGPGSALSIENTGGNVANNVQGTKVNGFTSICTGATAIAIGGDAFATIFTACIIDQAATNCVVIGGGASLTQLQGGYYGLASGSGGSAILVTPQAGVGTTIDGVQTFGGSNAISVQASGSARVGAVGIRNNTFNAASTVTVSLDSVNGCIVTGNMDLSTPTNGSWATLATFAAGAYTFGDNDWHSSSPASFDTNSSYHASPDRGITLANKGVAATVSGTSIVVPHGLTSVQPNVIRITQLGGPGMSSNVSSISGANFTISYGTSGPATFMWEAEYYT